MAFLAAHPVPVRAASRAVALHDAVGWMTPRLAAADAGAAWRSTVGERPDLGKVLVTMPPEGSQTALQSAFRSLIQERYPGIVSFRLKAVRPVTLGCRYPICDPPLRGGNLISTDAVSCTSAFLARSRLDAKLYQMTAGHCDVDRRANWLTAFTNGQLHVIGPVHSSHFDLSSDASLIRVNNPTGWRARAWVNVTEGLTTTSNPQYSIVSDADVKVGMRVCDTGARLGGTDCGTVTAVNVTVDYGDAVVAGMVESTLCAVPGDSGAPIFAGHTAYGLLSGAADLCDTFHEPIRSAENALRVNVAHDGG
ncbi:MAG: S1 family peptidase [Actinomycetes bacterium]